MTGAVAAGRRAGRGLADVRTRTAAVDPWVWAWVGLVVVTAVAVIGDDVGVFAPDTKPELYLNPDRLLRRSMSAWQADPSLGQPNYNTGILPVAAVMTAVQATGLEPWMMQRLTMIALLMIGSWGAARLVVELGGHRGAGPWLAGLVYAWHPWVVVGAATLPVRLPHAVLPWLLLATHRVVTRPGWRQAALASLAYGAMAGINGGVVNLMLAPAVPAMAAWSAWSEGVGWRRAVTATVRIAVCAVVVSLYWLVPLVVASSGAGVDVAGATESAVLVGQLSSPSEVLRGLGMWTSYIVLFGEPENLEQIGLLTRPVVVLGSMLLAGATAVAVPRLPARVRVLVGAGLALSAAWMIGLNDHLGRSGLGHALDWLFAHVPAALALRTTNKVGTVLVLVMALAIGAGVGRGLRPATGHASRTMRSRDTSARGLAVVVVSAITLVAAGPVLPGQLHPLQVRIPDYWEEAARATDTPSNDRLLLLPGNGQTRYLWGYRGVDDLDTALFDERHVAVRSAVPSGSRPGTNLLTAFDVQLQTRQLSPEGLTAFTRLLGAGQALVRTDVDWQANLGRPTSDVLDFVTSAPGVTVEAGFGPTGAQRASPAGVAPDDPALTLVGLPPTAMVSARPLAAPLILSGDAFAIDGLARTGLDPAGRPLLSLDALDGPRLQEALDAGGHLVLTDTNHRRAWEAPSATDAHTVVLAANVEVDPADQRSGSTRVTDQTVDATRGPRATAEPERNPLLLQPSNRPEFAFDHHVLTAWRPPGLAEDARLELRLEAPAWLEQATILLDPSSTRGVETLTVTTDAASHAVPVTGSEVRVSGLEDWTRDVTLGFEGGEGATVGVLDISLVGPGGEVRPIEMGLRLPRTLQQQHAVAPAPLRAAIDRSPTTLLLQRLQGDPTDPDDDEERQLRREIPMTTTRVLRVDTAVVRFSDLARPGTCRRVARLDGQPITVRVPDDVQAGVPMAVSGCGDPVVVVPQAEPSELVGSRFEVIDLLALDSGVMPAPSGGTPMDLQQTRHPGHGLTLSGDVAAPAVLDSGRAWDPGWTARSSVHGDLGTPVVVSGHAAGWLVPPGRQTIELRYAPQQANDWAREVSLAAVVILLLLGVGARRRRGGTP